jgi:hypothetical protein
MKPAKTLTPKVTPRQAKKLVLVPGRASDILASVNVGVTDQRRAKSALAAVSRMQRAPSRTSTRKNGATKREPATSKAASKATATTK